MEGNRQFYKCSLCGNLVGVIHQGGGTLVCCGQSMELLVPNTVDAAGEKHIPVLEYREGKLAAKVGSTEHPMLDEHYIEWIYVSTQNGGHRYTLTPGHEPIAYLCMERDEIESVYAYCNLHGLWQMKPE